LFNSIDKAINISVHFDKGKFWLTQKAMGELFGVDRSVVTKHLKNIFSSNELNQDSVCANFAHTALDGKNYNTQFYRLEAILAVGYRVNSSPFSRMCRTHVINLRPNQRFFKGV
jgi:hypothetical protein